VVPHVPALLGMMTVVGLTVERLDHNRTRAWVSARRADPNGAGGARETALRR
jgi:hypothetical protein